MKNTGKSANSESWGLAKHSAGVTLIEFVVALAVFALVASGLITAQLRTQELSAQTRHLTQMMTVLQSATDMFLVAQTDNAMLGVTNGFVSDTTLPFQDVDPNREGIQVPVLFDEDGGVLATGTLSRRVWVMSGAPPDTLLGAEFRITVEFRGRPMTRTLSINRSVNL